ncbi:MAG: hypothetical protein ACM3RP_03230 [Chitinophagales bacterium]
MSRRVAVGFVVAFLLVLAVAGTVLAGVPSGSVTGGVGDVAAVKVGQPTLSEVAAQVGKNKIAINMT